MMTTMTYAERLEAFAEGKRLGQLAKAVRDVEDGVCDACGSELPRTLFGLKDSVGDRCYFVGQSCLGWLKASSLVARARYRQSTEVAYRKEMERRRDGESEVFTHGIAATRGDGGAPRTRPDLKALRRTFFVAETESHYEAVVRLEDGHRRVSGHAQESPVEPRVGPPGRRSGAPGASGRGSGPAPSLSASSGPTARRGMRGGTRRSSTEMGLPAECPKEYRSDRHHRTVEVADPRRGCAKTPSHRSP